MWLWIILVTEYVYKTIEDHLTKHECICGKIIVDRENTISDLLRARLGLDPCHGGEGRYSGQVWENDKLMKEQAWILIIMSPVIWSVGY